MNAEKKIENYFCDKIRKIGGLSLKLVLFSGAGFPDRTVIFSNWNIFFVEFKTETGRLSKLQKFWQKTLSDYGFRFYVCRSKVEADIIIKAEFTRCYL